MYNVVVSPTATNVLLNYAKKFTVDNGEECAYRLVESFDQAVISLESMPERATRKLPYIPSKYRLIPFWKHMWLVFQIDNKNNTVMIDYVVDDRSSYEALFK
jgi:plasmid stabilization system protein ParE